MGAPSLPSSTFVFIQHDTKWPDPLRPALQISAPFFSSQKEKIKYQSKMLDITQVS